MDAINKFVKNFTEVTYSDLPNLATEAVKAEIVDSLATALGGSSRQGVGELVDIIKEMGGSKQSTIISYGIKCPSANAAQVNASMIHALDYDDGHQRALVHLGCVAVSTAFAVSERMDKKSGKDLIRAITLGDDFLTRLGLAGRPGQNMSTSGWHLTALNGYLGAAAIAGMLMNLDSNKMINALGIAYHQCAGNGQCVEDGALTKRMGPGFAARGGIMSALMAERGITGAKNVLEGRFGLFNLYHNGDYDIKILTDELGKRFEGYNVAFKPYPCCGFTHSFIDATLLLMKKYNIKPEQVDKINLTGGASAYTLCVPLEVKTAPRNTVDAQFSVPWTVATTLVKGKVTLEDFTEKAIKRQDVLDMAKKVTAELDPEMTRHGVGPGKVKLTLKGGKEYSEYIENCLGSVENPMTFDDCANKFLECSALAVKPLSKNTASKVVDMISRLEKLDDATEIIRMLA